MRGAFTHLSLSYFVGVAMNRFLSIIITLLLSLAGTAVAGYWNSRGVIALGDARMPAWFMGTFIVGVTSFVSLIFGGKIPWTKFASAVTSKITSTVKSASTRKTADNVTRDSVAAVPVQVEHLLACVYHLRVALVDDEEGQELLDKINIKIGRVSALITNKSKLETGGL